jgi:hypothetical protein
MIEIIVQHTQVSGSIMYPAADRRILQNITVNAIFMIINHGRLLDESQVRRIRF